MSSHQRNKHRLQCPHCGAFMRIRNSIERTPVFREGLVDCTNDACNFRGKFYMEVAFTVAPSDRPNPNISIEPTPYLHKHLARQYAEEHQINMFQPTNDADHTDHR